MHLVSLEALDQLALLVPLDQMETLANQDSLDSLVLKDLPDHLDLQARLARLSSLYTNNQLNSQLHSHLTRLRLSSRAGLQLQLLFLAGLPLLHPPGRPLHLHMEWLPAHPAQHTRSI